MIERVNELRYSKADVILFNSYFKDGTEVLSNFHACQLSYDGQAYNSSEQLFQVMRLSDYPEQQKVLMRCTTPKTVKQKAKHIFNRLKLKEEPEKLVSMLRFCIYVKYNQCEEFRKFLLRHPGKQIVEYAFWGDDTFGAVDEDESLVWKCRQGFVRGQNICGRLIQEVRKVGRTGDVIPVLPEGVRLPQPD